MCLLIVKPDTVKLDKQIINNAITSTQSNPDGFGVSILDFGKIVTHKTLDIEEFENVLYTYEGTKNPMLIHTRLTTHGKTNKENCHPFIVENYSIAHNGILSMPYIKPNEVDTIQFINHDLIHHLGEIENYHIIDNLSNYIGASNKIAILNGNTRNVTILNEKQGHWLEDVWYSNFSYEAWEPAITIPNKLKPFATRWEMEYFEYMDDLSMLDYIDELETRELKGYIPLNNDKTSYDFILD